MTVTASEAHRAAPGWRVLAGKLHATYATGTFATGAQFITRLTELAEEANHHPEVDLRYGLVHISMHSHDVGALTRRDLDLAAGISRLADELGIETRPHAAITTEIAIDALDIAAVKPFWRSVFGYTDGGNDDLVDPAQIGPALWFQQMDEPRPQRNRIHLDVWVAADLAEQRVAAVIEAGGRLVSDAEAPSFWVLADAEGNEACICAVTDS